MDKGNDKDDDKEEDDNNNNNNNEEEDKDINDNNDDKEEPKAGPKGRHLCRSRGPEGPKTSFTNLTPKYIVIKCTNITRFPGTNS